MSHLSPQRRHNFGSLSLPSPKQIYIEIYDKVSLTLGMKTFDAGTLAIMISKKSLQDRTVFSSDETLKFLGSLIARDETKHPQWEASMYQAVPKNGCVLYMKPEDRENYSALSVPDGTNMQSCPGAWCMQMAGSTPLACEESMSACLEHAILNSGGWQTVASTKMLARQANVHGKTWMDTIAFTLAPAASYPQNVQICCSISADAIPSFRQMRLWHMDRHHLTRSSLGVVPLK